MVLHDERAAFGAFVAGVVGAEVVGAVEAEVVLLAVMADAGLSPLGEEEAQWQRQECDWGPVGDDDASPVEFVTIAEVTALDIVEAGFSPIRILIIDPFQTPVASQPCGGEGQQQDQQQGQAEGFQDF